jgi:hypothetical protein
MDGKEISPTLANQFAKAFDEATQALNLYMAERVSSLPQAQSLS